MVESKSSEETADLDIVRKPRTNYSSHILVRALPNLNVRKKIETITMMNLKVLSSMRLPDKADLFEARRVKTLHYLPKKINFIDTNNNQ